MTRLAHGSASLCAFAPGPVLGVCSTLAYGTTAEFAHQPEDQPVAVASISLDTITAPRHAPPFADACCALWLPI